MKPQTQPKAVDKKAILDQSHSVLPAELVGKPTTSHQPKPDAEPKTVVSANALGRRSSRGGFSSSNLKIISLTKEYSLTLGVAQN